MTATPPKRWLYTVERITPVDGDTFDTRLIIRNDVGFRFNSTTQLDMRFRLEGIDTPERRGQTKAMGELAKETLGALLFDPGRVTLESTGEAYKYGGEWMARLVVEGKGDVGQWLIANGYARFYDGKTARSVWSPDRPYPLPPSER